MKIDYRKWKYRIQGAANGVVSGWFWNIDNVNNSAPYMHYLSFEIPKNLNDEDPKDFIKRQIKLEVNKIELNQYIYQIQDKELFLEDNLEYLENKYNEQQSKS